MQVNDVTYGMNIISWSKYADEFNSKSSFSSQEIHTGLGLTGIHPSEIVKISKSILDVGCGNGINTYLLAKDNDVIVTGIDPISSQIEQANKEYIRGNIEYFCCEFNHMPKQIVKHYDLITFFGSLDYIPLDRHFFNSLNIISKQGSRCFISKFHPFWTTLFGNDISEQLDNIYFIDGHEDIVRYGSSTFIRYHYTISGIIGLFEKHSWRLYKFLEPSPSLEHAAFVYKGYEYDSILRQRMNRFPMTALFEFVKEV